MPPRHTHVPPVQNNQPGTGFGSRGRSVGLVLSVTPLGKLPALHIGARGAIWAHIQIITPTSEPKYEPVTIFSIYSTTVPTI